MLVRRIRHNFPTNSDYNISRIGLNRFCFFHFSAPTSIQLGDRLIRTKANACIFYAPKETRQVTNHRPSLLNWVHLDTKVAELIKKYEIPLNCVFYPTNTSFIPTIFRSIEREYFSDEAYASTLIDGYVEEFLIKLSRAIHKPGKTHGVTIKEQLQISRVRDIVLSNPAKRWTVEEMAKQAALSTSRFHYVYKTLFRTTPIRDVIESKMDYAKTLLSEDFISVQDVAEKLGYKSPYYFIAQFKAVTGVSPGVYRKNHL